MSGVSVALSASHITATARDLCAELSGATADDEPSGLDIAEEDLPS